MPRYARGMRSGRRLARAAAKKRVALGQPPTPSRSSGVSWRVARVASAWADLQAHVRLERKDACYRIYREIAPLEVLNDAPGWDDCFARAEHYERFQQGEPREDVREALNGTPGHLCHLLVTEVRLAAERRLLLESRTTQLERCYGGFLGGELRRDVRAGKGGALSAFQQLFPDVDLLAEPYSLQDGEGGFSPFRIPMFDALITRGTLEDDGLIHEHDRYLPLLPHAQAEANRIARLQLRVRRILRVTDTLRRLIENRLLQQLEALEN